ncbi:hypothetical protein ACFPTY_19715 [Halomonas beimenensis]|uniref:hypothetical protein n=1 Tax=Halomonas beimenensis TaxID=475662 RepID=UPI0036205736
MTDDALAPPPLPTPRIADESIQLVDARNRPCGSAPRAAMRRYRYWHRATYIVVRNPPARSACSGAP